MVVIRRSLIFYSGLALITILLGLLSRSSVIELPWLLSLYAGDTLWAMMVFWLFCCIRPAARTTVIASLAVGFAFAIEFSQLYQAQWLNDIRHTRLGALVLGFGFKISDLVCYSLGILMAACLDKLITGRQKAR
ncbi:DUF2809 domain-containing protein [Pseudoalteromonas sp. OOF1S-7]|uniref:ribosomal maturation YjgA family protein n=1 Tax=Pseudoalteromonas sp. OOF1S-7 TaxID=2917757 RepID=UPI001EF73167|nr:DUF2809 domain-containing protein [Pseudoalteromonas sp. OOF1S-7]MCG7536648.1 DUF2809 domain-containing protein [Pseudoalteromonas sp. OOF1S-7]